MQVHDRWQNDGSKSENLPVVDNPAQQHCKQKQTGETAKPGSMHCHTHPPSTWHSACFIGVLTTAYVLPRFFALQVYDLLVEDGCKADKLSVADVPSSSSSSSSGSSSRASDKSGADSSAPEELHLGQVYVRGANEREVGSAVEYTKLLKQALVRRQGHDDRQLAHV